MRKSKYVGQVINNLEILYLLNETNNNVIRHYFVVRCVKCGQITKKDRFTMCKGQSKCSCSYKYEQHIEKGKTRLYNIWCNMKARCYNQKNHRYPLYGGRGIKVCDEWVNNYNNFYKWAVKNGYQDNLTIDRIDVDGNYEPNNCRWTTQKEQCNNQRRNHYLTYKGKTQSMSKWAEEIGINYSTLRHRINKLGWDIEKALNS